MSPTAQTRLIQIPTPRLAKKNVSGIEISRTSTRIVATEPISIASRLSGTVAGRVMPTSRNTTSRTAASPRKRTIFPIAPVCQPRTDTVVPTPSPVYQPVRAETARSNPKRSVSRPPSPGSPPEPNGRRARPEKPSIARRVWVLLRLDQCSGRAGVLTLLPWPSPLPRPPLRPDPRRRRRSIPERSRGRTDFTALGGRRARGAAVRSGGPASASGSYSRSWSP